MRLPSHVGAPTEHVPFTYTIGKRQLSRTPLPLNHRVHSQNLRSLNSSAKHKLSASSGDEVESLASEETQESVYPVQLRVYNIDRWGLAPVGGKLLRKEVDGIYHVAVAVHGQEYWFDHQIEQLNLHDVFYVRGFSPVYVYEMGYTNKEPEETEAFCFGHLKDKYNIETYDVFYHNCHHFARDLCWELTEKKIPQWLIDHGEQGLSELSEENANLVRIVSNKIARIMMVSWGRYSKQRFVEKQMAEKLKTTESALDPVPLAGHAPFFVDAQPSGVTNKGLQQILPAELLKLEKKRNYS
eukprot:g8713.t1